MPKAQKRPAWPPTTPKIVEPYSVTEERITQALFWIGHEAAGGNKVSIAAAARRFCVSAGRLRARSQGVQSKMQRPGANKKLSPDQEMAVCEYIDRLDIIGFSAREFMITDCANNILARAHTPVEGFSPPTVGIHWTPRFLERTAKYGFVKQQPQELARKDASMNPDAIEQWFEELRALFAKYGIQVEDTWNVDETGVRVGIGGTEYVVTANTDVQHTVGNRTNRKSITIVEAISGGGRTIPPMVILPGTDLQERWFTTTDIPDDTLLATTMNQQVSAAAGVRVGADRAC